MNRLSALAAEIGAVNSLLYLLAKGMSRLSGGRARLLKYCITAQPVPDADITPPRRGRSIDVGEVSSEQARGLPLGRPQHVIEQRLAAGTRCLIATNGGQLLGFQWFTLRDYEEDEVRCLFELRRVDKCAWDFDIFVFPEARLQPVFTRLWDTCNELLRKNSVDYSLSRINAFNRGSIRAHSRLGAEQIGWALFIILGSLQLSIFSVRPWLHLSLSSENAPVFPASRLARLKEKHKQFSERPHLPG